MTNATATDSKRKPMEQSPVGQSRQPSSGCKVLLDNRQLCLTLRAMIVSFKHRGLKRLFQRGDRSGVRPDLLEGVEDILGRLNEATTPQALNLPGYRLHPLKGELRGFWSVVVRANWRIIFRFEREDAFDVELIDYH
jgi:proteic killer suppression protein